MKSFIFTRGYVDEIRRGVKCFDMVRMMNYKFYITKHALLRFKERYGDANATFYSIRESVNSAYLIHDKFLVVRQPNTVYLLDKYFDGIYVIQDDAREKVYRMLTFLQIDLDTKSETYPDPKVKILIENKQKSIDAIKIRVLHLVELEKVLCKQKNNFSDVLTEYEKLKTKILCKFNQYNKLLQDEIKKNLAADGLVKYLEN